MRRGLGYILVFAGLAILALGIKPVNDYIVKNVPQLSGFDPIVLLGIGFISLILGIIIMRGKSSKIERHTEVPIFHGKDVVGYRRH